MRYGVRAIMIVAAQVAVLIAGAAFAADLRLALGALPASPDPNFEPSLFARPIYGSVYDTLVEAGDGAIVPSLVESWRAVDDVTWEFTVRDGVLFHNGEAFDAEALKWNLDHVRDPAAQSRHAFRVALVEDVEVVDARTVRVVTERPFGSLLSNLTFLYMLPPRYFDEVGQSGFNAAPVGTGPFRIVDWVQDESIDLERFEDHWRGAPQLDSMHFQLMPEASTRMAALEAGEVDVIYAVPPEHTARLEATGFEIVSSPIGHSFVITLRNDQGTPLDDVRVRRAVNLAVDQDLIIEQLLGGHGRRLEGQLVGPGDTGYNPELEAYGFDPDEARRLLAEAGHPDGFEIDLECPSGRYIKDREVCEAVASMLARVGIRANLQILESGVWLERWVGNTFAPMFNVAILYAPPMDLEFASPQIVGASSAVTYADPSGTMRDLFDRQQATLDQGEREQILREMAARAHEEVVYLFLFQVPNIVAASPSVSGLAFRPDYSFQDVLVVTTAR